MAGRSEGQKQRVCFWQKPSALPAVRRSRGRVRKVRLMDLGVVGNPWSVG